MTGDELAAIRSHIGTRQPPRDVDLAAAFARLGTVEAVALEVVRGRLADMRARPAKFQADGDFAEDFTANLAALERQEASLATAVATGGAAGAPGFVTVGHIRRDRARR